VWWVSVEIVSEWLNRKKSGTGHVTLFCCRALARCSAPCGPISFPSRYSVVSVCENSEWMIELRRRLALVMLLCFVGEHWLYVLLLVDQFHCPRGSVWWLSVEIVSEWLNKKKCGAGHVTLFCCKALARCSAPWSPIWLLRRFSVVSVCENSDWMIE